MGIKLENKIALVTGGGSGVGREIAFDFAREGAKIVVADISAEGGQETVRQIKEAGSDAIFTETDMSSEADVTRMIEAAVKAFGRLDILVNNAGITDMLIPLIEMPSDLWRKVMGVNLDGPFFACRQAVPIMISQGGGAIINIASVSAFAGGRGGPAYTASKHGLAGLTKNIAQAYGAKNIRCNAICPGGIKTEMRTGGGFHPEGLRMVKKLGELKPRGNAEPAEIARVACFLASGDASFVNGAILVVDGGWTAI